MLHCPHALKSGQRKHIENNGAKRGGCGSPWSAQWECTSLEATILLSFNSTMSIDILFAEAFLYLFSTHILYDAICKSVGLQE